MTSRRTSPAARVIAVALAALFLAPGVAAAAAPGANGWYWPTGTSETGNGGGWLQWRRNNRSWHLAKDIKARYGTPVYALSDGYVVSAYKRLSGYTPGGAMVVAYRTADGSWFKALYGHINRFRVRKGSVVKAGQVLAYVGRSRPTHLHFGIHPTLAKPTDRKRNIFAGHTYKAGQYYGWVDPLAFLSGNRPWGSVVPSATPAPTSTPTPPAP